MEETGAFWSEIDTKDCESSLATLQALARKVMKDKDVESCKDMNDVTKLMAKGKTLTESPFKWHGKMEKLSQQENKGGKTVEKLSEESEENGMSLACTEILSASPDFVLETPNLVMAIGENSDESGDPREMNVHRRNPLLKVELLFKNSKLASLKYCLFQSATINGDDLYRTSTPVRQSETITSGSPSSSESPKPFESPVLNGVVPKSSGAVKADVWIPPMAPTDSQSKSTISTSPPKSAKQSTTAANKVALDLGDRNNNSHENRRSDSISLPSSARLTTEESLATPTSAELKPQVEGGTEVSKALMPDTFSDADVESDRVKPSKCHFCSDVEFHRPEELEIHLYADHIVMRDGSGFQCPRCDSDKVIKTNTMILISKGIAKILCFFLFRRPTQPGKICGFTSLVIFTVKNLLNLPLNRSLQISRTQMVVTQVLSQLRLQPAARLLQVPQ